MPRKSLQSESAALLWDVHAAETRIIEFIVGLDADEYVADELRRSAVERQLNIVGEALKNLRNVDPDTAHQIPEIARIIGLRNILAHGYAIVDDAVVWVPHHSACRNCSPWWINSLPTDQHQKLPLPA